MPPEQFDSLKKVNKTGDIYSFGVVLFEMITGEVPFKGTHPEIMYGHIHSKIPSILKRAPEAPPEFQNIIEKSMAKKPEDRYQNAEEFLSAIKKLENKLKKRKKKVVAASKKVNEIENFNAKIRELIEQERYDEALAIIEKAENLNCADETTYSLKKKIDEIVEELVKQLHKAVINKSYGEGKQYLREIIEIIPSKTGPLQEEFGFIYDFDELEKDEENWKQREAQIDWRRKVWQVVSGYTDFKFDRSGEGELEDASRETPAEEKIEKAEPNYDRKGKTSAQIGADLEKAVLALFEKFLTMCKEEFKIEIKAGNEYNGKPSIKAVEKKRRQSSGTQYGYDLEFDCLLESERKLKLRIECKSQKEKLTLNDIAGKLAAIELNFANDPIDHFIVICTDAGLTNDLNLALNSWEHMNKYPFKVQVWSREVKVYEFFGLIPEIYDVFFKPAEGQEHPKDWDTTKQQEVIDFWKQKLEPPLRLTGGWDSYLRDPAKLILEPKELEFQARYHKSDYVSMNCTDETGAVLPQTLEEKIYEWLDEPVSASPTIFLLGEFGDGKTFFTYVLARKLVEKFLKSPQGNWVPVRFALKNFGKNFEADSPKHIQDFVEQHLKDFGVDISGWNDLINNGHKLFVILDGFDEISKELDPDTIQRNIDILIYCYQSRYFSGLKILITSRKHFFENRTEKDWLIDKLDKPQMLHLSPIDRKTAEDYLREYAVDIGEEEKFDKLRQRHDPIGLSSKPLFLDMVQSSLKKLPVKDLNEFTLYETYIRQSLERKEELRYDKKKKTPKGEILENSLNVLEEVAQNLHLSDREYVYLSDVRGKTDLKKWLWDLSDPDKKTIIDETGRVATRSLLKQVNLNDDEKVEEKKWPVDFCHRSMREYFVARAVCRKLVENQKQAEKFLRNCFLSHEILFFAAEIMKQKGLKSEDILLKLIAKTKNVKKMDVVKLGYLGGNAVNLLYRYKGELPGQDWSNLVLDGAILPDADLSKKDFSYTSLRYANLDNADFTGSDFSYCDLTEVRIEETTTVQSIAVSANEDILASYDDGTIREWTYRKSPGIKAATLTENMRGKELSLIPYPGNDVTILHDAHLLFYDRVDNKLEKKAAIPTNPGIKLIKAGPDYLLLHEKKDGKQNRLILKDLHQQRVVKSPMLPSFTLCDHFDDRAMIIFDKNEELRLIDLTFKKSSQKNKILVHSDTQGERDNMVIPTGEKVSCLITYRCKDEAQYLLGLGLYNGVVQVWQIRVDDWTSTKILEQTLHEKQKPVKDICFIDESRIVSGGLDKTIRVLTFDRDGQPVGEPVPLRMSLQCRGMKIKGVTGLTNEKKAELIARGAVE